MERYIKTIERIYDLEEVKKTLSKDKAYKKYTDWQLDTTDLNNALKLSYSAIKVKDRTNCRFAVILSKSGQYSGSNNLEDLCDKFVYDTELAKNVIEDCSPDHSKKIKEMLASGTISNLKLAAWNADGLIFIANVHPNGSIEILNKEV